MLNVLYTELLKLKRSNIIWLTIIGGLLPVCITTVGEFPHMDWNNLLINNLLFLNVMIGPMLLALIAGFVVVREYTENTVNQLFVYPQSRVTILIGKMIVILLLTASIFLINYALIWLSGSIIGDHPIPSDFFWKHTKAYVWMFSLHALLIPLTMAAGIIGRSYIPPVVLGIIAILTNMMAIQGVEGHTPEQIVFVSYLPFGSMIVHLLDLMKANVHIDVLHALYPNGIAFVVFFILNALFYTKAEVHSGS
ncbi:ABC transporter permease [Brevibacillus sp. 179-C 1.1 NHS]|uniref:ABC transporter permease n=1 Tax=Brevibacillus sp. 179-C 1.1 NHS TaxID=3235177 RepID=UPI0039A02E89